MKIFRNFEEARGIRNPVVTTGSFDGVHIGHKTILKRLKMLAEKYNGESVLITFDPHPRKVLYPDTVGRDLKLINSTAEKLCLLRKEGLDNLIIINFTREFSKITSEEFIRDYLHNILNARVIVAGFNHHFGFNKEGDYKQLWGWRKKYGFEAEEIPEQEIEHETVSSTNIRKAIREGYIQRANAYLDHYYMIIGLPEDYSIQETRGMPYLMKIPVNEESKLLPSPGIYAATAVTDTATSKAMAMVMNGDNDTQEVLIHFFTDAHAFAGKETSFMFHRKIHGSINLSDEKIPDRLLKVRDEIAELIY